MRFNSFDTETAEAQIRLLFHIKAIFNRRGLKVASYEEKSSLTFPASLFTDSSVYNVLKSRTCRKILSFISSKKVSVKFSELKDKFSHLADDKIKEIIDKALETRLLKSSDEGHYVPYQPNGDFGASLEWFVASIFVEEFSCIAYWGVKLQEVGLGGDYDVIVSREGDIGYIECKSGQWSNIKPEHVKEFLKRERWLSPNFSIFLADDISHEKLEKLVGYALEERKEYAFEVPGMMDTGIILEKEVYKNFIRLIPINCFFIASEDSIIEKFREVLRFLTLVHDRPMPFENIAAKEQFKVKKRKK